ncbi:MAG TPA: HAD-IA family hydrolase [Steroidobacteraceae bacterium]|nr:HAD-IA family hydrolase [Steroidobacteraceae bacterium]
MRSGSTDAFWPAETPPDPLQVAGRADTAPRALLLDFGSVISVSPFESHRNTERLLNLPAGSLTWLGPLDPATDPLWSAMQRDEITERDYWAKRAREIGVAAGEADWDMATMLSRLRHTDPNDAVRPEMRRLIRKARAGGMRVGVLSNEFELFYGPDMLERIDVLREMDAIVDATHTKILKPDPRAYALALQALQLPAHEVLFVDDQFRNVAGAVRAGLQTQFFDLRDVAGNIAAIAARLKLT